MHHRGSVAGSGSWARHLALAAGRPSRRRQPSASSSTEFLDPFGMPLVQPQQPDEAARDGTERDLPVGHAELTRGLPPWMSRRERGGQTAG